MNKKILTITLITLVLVSGGFYFWNNKYDQKIVSQEQEELINDEVDISDWETYCNEEGLYCFEYPSDELVVVKNNSDQLSPTTVLSLKQTQKSSLIFYARYSIDASHGTSFADIYGYERQGDAYQALFADGKKQEVVFLEKINNNFADIITITGTEPRYTTMSPDGDYAAIVNLQASVYKGLAVYVDNEVVDYNTFKFILESFRESN